MTNLVQQILEIAKERGITQKRLAEQAHLKPAALSRAKRTGAANFKLVDNLAQAAGLRLVVLDREAAPAALRRRERTSFEDRHRGLAWSNPDASRETIIRQALVRPTFDTLLDAALAVGVDRLEAEWNLLKAGESPESRRAQRLTEKILRNIRHGYEQAQA